MKNIVASIQCRHDDTTIFRLWHKEFGRHAFDGDRPLLGRLRNVEHVLDKLTADVATLRLEYFALLQSVRRIEETLSLQVERDARRDADLKEIFARLERVESRLERIESQGRSN